MNKRGLFISLVFAVLGIVMLVLYQQRFVAEASGGEKIKLLTAAKLIEHGKVVTEDMLAVREVPLAYVEDRAVKEIEKAKVLGLQVNETIQAQQTLLWTDFVEANEGRTDLSSLVQPGSRGVTIQLVNESSSVALIRPGDFVDVFAVMSQERSENKIAVVLLQRVLVLATGLETSPDSVAFSYDKRTNRLNVETSSLLTLSMPVPEAQLLALAQEKGRLGVALRNREDQRTAVTIPDLDSRILLDPAQRASHGMVHAGAPVETAGGMK